MMSFWGDVFQTPPQKEHSDAPPFWGHVKFGCQSVVLKNLRKESFEPRWFPKQFNSGDILPLMVEILKTQSVDLLSLSLDNLKVSIQYILKGVFFLPDFSHQLFHRWPEAPESRPHLERGASPSRRRVVNLRSFPGGVGLGWPQ